MKFDTRQYVIFNTSEVNKIDFSQVMESSVETLRVSVDGTKTFVKWENDIPPCILTLETKGDYLNHSQMIDILSTEDWVSL